MIFLCSDHGGFALKELIKKYFIGRATPFDDLGCHTAESCDYPDLAHALARRMLEDPKDAIGIALCGTGIGMSIALNRHTDIRAARCTSTTDALLARQHNDANVLVLGGRQLSKETAFELVRVFLDTEFEGGRHEKRIAKIESGK